MKHWSSTNRLILLMMLLIQLFAFAYFETTIYFCLFMFCCIPLSYLERFQFNFPAGRRFLITLALSIPFAVHWMMFPYNPDNAYFLHPMTHSFAHYFIFLQVIQLFGREDCISSLTPLFGTLVIIACGNFFSSPEQDSIYAVTTIAFAIFSAFFYMNRNFYTAKSPSTASFSGIVRNHPLKFSTLALLILLSSLTAGFSGYLIQQNKHDIDSYLFGLTTRFSGVGGRNFSDTSRIGSLSSFRNRISENKTVLRIFSRHNPGYFRGMVYADYINTHWKNRIFKAADKKPEKFPKWAAEFQKTGKNFFQITDLSEAKCAVFEVWPDSFLENTFFSPDHPMFLVTPAEQVRVFSDDIIRFVSKTTASPYTVFTSLTHFTNPLSNEEKKFYLDTSFIKDTRIPELSHTIFEGCKTLEEKVEAVESFFHKNFSYVLGTDIPAGKDPLSHFLFDLRASHCEFFATAACILLRFSGTPARYVTGFMITDKSPFDDYWIARNRDAHAWVEAYSGDRGWVTVEATPGNGLPGFQQNTWTVTYALDFLISSLNEFIQAVKTTGIKEGLLLAAGKLVLLFKGMLSFHPVTLVFILLAAFFFLYRKFKSAKTSPVIAYHNTLLTPLLKKMDRALLKSGLSRQVDETLLHFSTRIDKSGLDSCTRISAWYRSYSSIRYSRFITQETIDSLADELERLSK